MAITKSIEDTITAIGIVDNPAILQRASESAPQSLRSFVRLIPTVGLIIVAASAKGAYAQQDYCRDVLLRNETETFSYSEMQTRLTVYARQDYQETRDKALHARSEGAATVPIDGLPVPVDWVLSFDKESHDRIAYQSYYYSTGDYAAKDLLYSSFNGITSEQVEAWRNCMNGGRLASLSYKYPVESQACDQWLADLVVTLDSHGFNLSAGAPTVTFVNCEEVGAEQQAPSPLPPGSASSLQQQVASILGVSGIKQRVVTTRIRSIADGPAQLVLSFGGVAPDDSFVILPPVRLVQCVVDLELACVTVESACDRPGQGHGPVKVRVSGMSIRDAQSGTTVLADPRALESQTSTSDSGALNWAVNVPCHTRRLLFDIPHVTGNCQGNDKKHAGHEHSGGALSFVMDIMGPGQLRSMSFFPAADKPPGRFEVSFKASARTSAVGPR